jgi:predicted HAD superfamily Cof-like phosphohydrolase
MSAAVPEQAHERGDNADEVIRLRDALYEAEHQTSRWIGDAAKWERYADELRNALRDILNANPDAPAGAYAVERARLALGDAYDAAREPRTAPGPAAAAESTASPEQMLREFHASLNVHGGLAPQTPTADVPDWVRGLRLALLDEEVDELREAMHAGDVVKIADALADIAYVVVGTAVPYGIPFDEVFREVHRSNMTKTNDPGLGKLLKGPGYEAPRIAELLAGAEPGGNIADHPDDWDRE